ncbi:MAG: GNAT family N-acetyltransferase [Coriobacteriia bacterium]|nr:GNAT family N-acetyltransferase [Coriobacteriia bacterium]
MDRTDTGVAAGAGARVDSQPQAGSGLQVALRPASRADFPQVCALYDRVIAQVAGTAEDPLWDRSVHPNDEGLLGAIAQQALFVAETAGGPGGVPSGADAPAGGDAAGVPDGVAAPGAAALVGAVVLDHQFAQGYDRAPWQVSAAAVGADRIGVIHLLACDPAAQGRGLGRALLAAVVCHARAQGWKALRLDVLPNLATARHLYETAGFACLGTFRLTYPDPRVKNFALYELVL